MKFDPDQLLEVWDVSSLRSPVIKDLTRFRHLFIEETDEKRRRRRGWRCIGIADAQESSTRQLCIGRGAKLAC